MEVQNKTQEQEHRKQRRSFMSRFVNYDDLGWFLKTMVRVTNEELGETYGDMTKPFKYFVDFLRYGCYFFRRL